jgi:hypothetical protein
MQNYNADFACSNVQVLKIVPFMLRERHGLCLNTVYPGE